MGDHRNKLIKRMELIYSVQESEDKAKKIKNIITIHGYDKDHDVYQDANKYPELHGDPGLLLK